MWKLKSLSLLCLWKILEEVLETAKREFGNDVFTQIFKKYMDGRHVDLREHSRPRGRAIESFINALYQYDHERPEMMVCWYHESKKGEDDWHLHFQVHPNTRKREAPWP